MILLLILILAIAAVSFALGAAYQRWVILRELSAARDRAWSRDQAAMSELIRQVRGRP